MKSFEKRLERLEEIAEKLRDGAVPIDEASTLFEEGVKLARALESELRKLERRIEILVQEDPPVLEPFSETDNGEKAEDE